MGYLIDQHFAASVGQGWNSNATNETGFSAIPGGFRYNNGRFNSVGYYAYSGPQPRSILPEPGFVTQVTVTPTSFNPAATSDSDSPYAACRIGSLKSGFLS